MVQLSYEDFTLLTYHVNPPTSPLTLPGSLPMKVGKYQFFVRVFWFAMLNLRGLGFCDPNMN